ncbi:MAG: ATP-binding cassette domain-containing protein [Castellaniella sp.]
MSLRLITLNQVHLAYGHHPLLDGASLTVHRQERIGLIGRNGAGKSSLLRLIDGRSQPDDGEIQSTRGLRTATVEQEPVLDDASSVLDTLCGNFQADEDWERPARAAMLMAQLGLDADAPIAGLSGGTRKRVALARAIVSQPDLLLLDEPTNHLDFAGIEWLEKLLLQSRFSCIIITHDRRFLDHVTTRIVELDRGQLHSFPGNYSAWLERKRQWLAAEAQEEARADKFLAQEEIWIRKGVQARRTRDEGRVRRLERLRRERAQRRERMGEVSMALEEGRRSGRLVAELSDIHHGFGERLLIRGLSLTILRGDRIGLLGPNGSGKTTLLNIILGKLTPQRGSVRLGTNLDIGYFDQMRSQLDEDASLAETISPGSEWVEIGNQRKHIMRYLEDFLFAPERAQSPVRSLSGGERARLVLARLFARPTNLLVLDEPTNDLDIETLELLEALLQDYTGTVLMVSHDREFLNNVVTQTLVAEGEGHWQEYAGGYDDWLAQRPDPEPEPAATPRSPDAGTATVAPPRERPASRPPRPSRMTSWETRELEALPARIQTLEAEQAQLAEQLADPELYRGPVEDVEALNARNSAIEAEMEQLFERWEELEAKREASEA